MSGKFKKHSDLCSRQKRRRINNIFENRIDGEDSEIFDEIEGRDENNDNGRETGTGPEDNVDVAAADPGGNIEDATAGPADNIEGTDDKLIDDDDRNDNIEENNDNFDGRVVTDNEESNSDSSEDESVDDEIQEDIAYLQKKALKNLFLSANINHTQGNMILKTLRQFLFNLISLPKDSRTVLNTPTIVASTMVKQVAGGEYLHIGLKKTLIKKLESIPADLLPPTLIIDFSTDGAKVDKGKDQFWPIQYRIINILDKRPIIAGIYQGRHKPSNCFEFFEDFFQEISEMEEEEGIMIRNRLIPFKLRCFIADAPARAFGLNHYGHSSSCACSKCKVEGRRCVTPGFEGTMVFPGVEHVHRTDEDYANNLDEDHQKGRSPLSPFLPLVSRVPFEIMHSVYLGNVKKICAAHIQGKFGFRRMNARKLDILDIRMKELQLYCPSEFNRRPEDFRSFSSFKATECRQFLLYVAPAIVKDVFSEDHYKHLMILHSIMRLLVSEETPQYMYPFCQDAMKTYVSLSESLYGEQFLSYNLHSALHFVEDVENLGPAETFSAFCYENNMQELRKYVRKPGLKLPQIYKRISERDEYALNPIDHSIKSKLSQPHAEGPLPQNISARFCRQFAKLEVGKFTFSTQQRDSCCILRNSKICIIRNIIKIREETQLVVQQFKSTADVYDAGVKSTKANVFCCKDLEQTLRAISLTDITNKMYIMPQWSGVEGQEERVLGDKWICVCLLSPFLLPENINIQ